MGRRECERRLDVRLTGLESWPSVTTEASSKTYLFDEQGKGEGQVSVSVYACVEP